MSFFSDRLRSARVQAGLTVKEAVARFDLRGVHISEKTLYGWEKGLRTPDADVFLTICQVYDISSFSAFLETKNSQDGPSASFLLKYNALDAHGKRLVDLVLQEEYLRIHPAQTAPKKTEKIHTPVPASPVIEFPVSDQSVAAGTGTYLDDDSFSTQPLPAQHIPNRAEFAVPVHGNSMEPLYHEGDLLMISTKDVPAVGEIGIFLLDGLGYVKKRGRRELISLNPDYAPIPMNEEIRCFGKVIGVVHADQLQ